MDGTTLLFIILGAASLTAQLFKIIDWIEKPAKRGERK